MLCTYLFTAELIPANPMPQVGRPKTTKTLPKSLHHNVVTALVAVNRQRRSDPAAATGSNVTAPSSSPRFWPACAPRNSRANIGDLRRTDDGAVIHVRGKGDKDRRIPIEAALVDVLEHYLDSRNTDYRHRQTPLPHRGTGRLAAERTAVRRHDGQRITRGTLQYRVLRAFKKAGIDGNAPEGRCCTAFVTPSPPNSPTPRSASTP